MADLYLHEAARYAGTAFYFVSRLSVSRYSLLGDGPATEVPASLPAYLRLPAK